MSSPSDALRLALILEKWGHSVAQTSFTHWTLPRCPPEQGLTAVCHSRVAAQHEYGATTDGNKLCRSKGSPVSGKKNNLKVWCGWSSGNSKWWTRRGSGQPQGPRQTDPCRLCDGGSGDGDIQQGAQLLTRAPLRGAGWRVPGVSVIFWNLCESKVTLKCF
jgi:hypothetical protein